LENVFTASRSSEKGICYIRNVEINGLIATENNREAFYVDGDVLAPIQNFVFKNVKIESGTAGTIRNAKGWKSKDSKFSFQDKSFPEMENCTEMNNFLK